MLRLNYLRGGGQVPHFLRSWITSLLLLNHTQNLLKVVVLVIYFPKWAHLSLNFARLLKYDATKLATTRAFSAICIGKSPKNLSLCFRKIAQTRKNSTPDQFLGLNFGSDLGNMLLHNCIGQTFDFFEFWRLIAVNETPYLRGGSTTAPTQVTWCMVRLTQRMNFCGKT